MTQHVVDYTNTLALIAKGFNSQCAYRYTASGAAVENVVDGSGDPILQTNTQIVAAAAAKRCAPTYAQIVDWFDTTHGLKIDIINYFNEANYNKYVISLAVTNETKKKKIVSNGYWTSKMDAYNEAIKKALTLV
jgi:hypothetical protein